MTGSKALLALVALVALSLATSAYGADPVGAVAADKEKLTADKEEVEAAETQVKAAEDTLKADEDKDRADEAASGGSDSGDETPIGPYAVVAAIGDIHGDLDAFRSAVLSTGLFAFDGEWKYVGKEKDMLVLTGDLVDRGPNSKAVLTLAEELGVLAPKNVIQLNGNHEVKTLQVTDQMIPTQSHFFNPYELARYAPAQLVAGLTDADLDTLMKPIFDKIMSGQACAGPPMRVGDSMAGQERACVERLIAMAPESVFPGGAPQWFKVWLPMLLTRVGTAGWSTVPNIGWVRDAAPECDGLLFKPDVKPTPLEDPACGVFTAEELALYGPARAAYIHEFSSNGHFGQLLRSKGVIAQVYDTLYMHGGMTPTAARYTLDDINDAARAFYDTGRELPQSSREKAVYETVWLRPTDSGYGCKGIKAGAKDWGRGKVVRQVVGHNPTENDEDLKFQKCPEMEPAGKYASVDLDVKQSRWLRFYGATGGYGPFVFPSHQSGGRSSATKVLIATYDRDDKVKLVQRSRVFWDGSSVVPDEAQQNEDKPLFEYKCSPEILANLIPNPQTRDDASLVGALPTVPEGPEDVDESETMLLQTSGLRGNY